VIKLRTFVKRIKGKAHTRGIAPMKAFKQGGGAKPRLTSGGIAVSKEGMYMEQCAREDAPDERAEPEPGAQPK
jgi:hypothetical protein